MQVISLVVISILVIFDAQRVECLTEAEHARKNGFNLGISSYRVNFKNPEKWRPLFPLEYKPVFVFYRGKLSIVDSHELVEYENTLKNTK